ncbi:putative tRNA endonuclease-like domain superfamily, tRNA-splicing endonuclease subunit Sen15 [Septoria linicola]|nr:putative tRNA endonuclease-like domain superfamily, tRNA-splicing endonuclease subunit Sen15 [Septoria linicola]
MGAPDATQVLRPASALQTFLSTHPAPPDSPHLSDHHNLSLQIAHNLHYQHLWTHIYLHTTSPSTSSPLPRPIISGLPPQRLYVHPDEQIALLQAQKDQGKSGMPELAREREWVLPSHLREQWSLRRLGEVFDRISASVPMPSKNSGQAQLLFGELAGDNAKEESEEGAVNEWREKSPKRVLLATLDDDSTVVYYIVHDGIVKPRQN